MSSPDGAGRLCHRPLVHVLAGPFLAAAALLVVAGAQKLSDPAPLVRALRPPGGARTVRLLAAVEVVVGLSAGTGSRGAALAVAGSYAVFTAVVVRALLRGGVLASCGCFGRADTPPTRTHVVVTAGAVVVALLVAVDPAPVPWDVAVLVPAAAVAATAYLALAVLPLLPVRGRA
ncbi:MAG: hypothetical protein JWM64_2363 [Frankiales bacterium]|nr:hypothetical protein [Frankiales bacterium]